MQIALSAVQAHSKQMMPAGGSHACSKRRPGVSCYIISHSIRAQDAAAAAAAAVVAA